MATTSASSLKERAEAQIISELVEDPALRALIPKKQNDDSKIKLPYISVTAADGREISPQAGLYNITVSIGVNFKYPNNEAESLDVLMGKIKGCMTAAQARQDYAVMIDGEASTQFINETVRRRIFVVRLIAG